MKLKVLKPIQTGVKLICMTRGSDDPVYLRAKVGPTYRAIVGAPAAEPTKLLAFAGTIATASDIVTIPAWTAGDHVTIELYDLSDTLRDSDEAFAL